MSNVIAFRRPTEPQTEVQTSQGATFFVNFKNTNLIAHLAKPQGQRTVRVEKTNRS